MPTVKFLFPGGRYHATPWGHHVNEGLIEWPPSPWRLLRALIACGFTRQGWSEIPPIARRLIDKLAAVLPLYRLPVASAAHSRHYMPYLEGNSQKTTLVFDTWANVGAGELLIHWPCELDAEESELLGKLASSLGYLGRSESWVESQLADDVAEWNAVPCQEGVHRGPGWEQVSLMTAIPSDDYRRWYEDATAPILATIQAPSGRRVTAHQRERYESQCQLAVSPYPGDLASCLTKDTVWWKGHGWSQPPGSRRVLYWRPRDALQVGVPPPFRVSAARPVSTMLLAITTASGNRSALPHVTRTLPQAELLHRAIIGRLGNGLRVDCPELTGKDQQGRPLRDRHEHSHVIPVDLDDDGRIDHVIVHARMGLRDFAQRAIRNLRKTWTKGGAADLQVAVVASGSVHALRRLPGRQKGQVDKLLGPSDGARVWRSATPFVAPRFIKRRGKDTLQGQVNAELAARGLPEAESVVIDPTLTREVRHFVRRRTRGGVLPKVDAGYGIKLTFTLPLSLDQHGPMSLGYASHYGLGLFHAELE